MKYPSTLGMCKPGLAVLPYESSDLGGRPGIVGGKRRSVPHSGRGSPLVVLWRKWSDWPKPSPRVGGSVAVFLVGRDCGGSHSSGYGGSGRATRGAESAE